MIKHVLSLVVTGWLAVSTTALEADSPVIVGQTFLASGQDPTSDSAPWALISHGIAEKLFVVNENDEIIPQIAESVKKVEGIVQEVELGDEPIVWEVVLKPYKFSDGTPVTADHVVACLTELNEKNPSASSSLGKMTLTAALLGSQ